MKPTSATAPTSSKGDELGQLMLRYATGETAVFSRLYPPIAQYVTRVLRRYLRSDEAVNDALQMVFVRGHRTRARFEPQRATRQGVLSWYGGIAKFVAFDELRGTQRRVRRLEHASRRGTTYMAESKALSSSPEELLESRQDERTRAHELRAAMRRLTASQREVLELLYLRDMDFPEVSRRLHVSTGTLRVRAHRGRAQLRGHLAATS